MTMYSQELDGATRDFYINSLKILNNSGLPYLVGGAYALGEYAGISRHTRDLDLFVRQSDCQPVLDLLAANGYRTELTFSHWLGKAFFADEYIDVIFSSGNGIVTVDDTWFEKATISSVFGVKVCLCPAEEMIWSKSFVMERERFDGADIAHIIRTKAAELDWERLIARFDNHWRLLLTHLLLFGFVYPEERNKVPQTVMSTLLNRAQAEMLQMPPEGTVCNGTLLSREQYLIDVDLWHYSDARLSPKGKMSRKQIEQWTAAISSK